MLVIVERSLFRNLSMALPGTAQMSSTYLRFGVWSDFFLAFSPWFEGKKERKNAVFLTPSDPFSLLPFYSEVRSWEP